MKRLIVIFVMALPFLATAQLVEGTVTYEQKINLHKRMQGNEEMKAMIPEFQTSKMQLLLKGQVALFQNKEEEEESEIEGDHNGSGMVIRMQRPENIVYRNFETKQRIEQRDFFGKKFLIEDEFKVIPWKITGESKKINNYVCQKAIWEDTENESQVVAWFTPSIPSPAGPANYGQLPGLVLYVDIDEGSQVFAATEIVLESLEENIMTPPSKGKKISREKFDQLMEERLKEMNASGSGGVRIITRTTRQ